MHMHVRNWVIRTALVAVAALLGGAAVPQSAEARTIAGSAGLTGPENRGCWWPYNGAMLNNFCNRTVEYQVPLVIDNGGVKDVSVTAQGSGPSSNVGCRSEATNLEASYVLYSNGGAYQYLGLFGGPYEIQLNNGPSVPGWGQLLVSCRVDYGAKIYSVWWQE
jgi:hypothetical protein